MHGNGSDWGALDDAGTQGVLNVVFTRSRGWRAAGSAVIRAMPPFGSWSHCATLRGDARSVVEAVMPRVRLTPLLDLVARSSEWGVMRVPVPDLAAGLQAAEECVGLEYDTLGLVGFPLRHRGLQRPHKLFCVEQSLLAVTAGGLPVVEDGRTLLTPVMLSLVLWAAGGRWAPDDERDALLAAVGLTTGGGET